MDEFMRNASTEDFKRGYTWNSKKAKFVCLICGEHIDEDNVNNHVVTHGSPLERLMLLDKKYIGLTELQKEFLKMLSCKYSDKEIAIGLGCSESTVRNMRFALRERAKQARGFLAAMELADEAQPRLVPPRLQVFPSKEEKRKALLPRFAVLFEPNKEYTEMEVKKVIKAIYEDDAIIRRYLVDYGYLNRTKDGSKYYRRLEKDSMDNINKKELINKYKQQEVEMGIIQVYNTISGYSFVDISTNLYKPFEALKFQLNMGICKLKSLQQEWSAYGEKSFEFKIVEKLKAKEGAANKETVDDLKELLKLWLDSQGDNIKLYSKI